MLPPKPVTQLKFLLLGPVIAAAGIALIGVGFFVPDIRSFLWPFDGIISVIGGIGLFVWFVKRGLRLK
jgi:hypothetical protein